MLQFGVWLGLALIVLQTRAELNQYGHITEDLKAAEIKLYLSYCKASVVQLVRWLDGWSVLANILGGSVNFKNVRGFKFTICLLKLVNIFVCLDCELE